MKTMAEYVEECKKCLSSTLGIDLKCFNGEECEIKKGHFEAHKRELCESCTVYGCANNPKGYGRRGAILIFDIPDDCVYLDGDPSL